MFNNSRYKSLINFALIFLTIIFIGSCSQISPTSSLNSFETTPAKNNSISSSAAQSDSQTYSSYFTAQVVDVIDGDTIEVSIYNSIYKVRYIGIDTQELVNSSQPANYYGQISFEKNKELVEGKIVGLEKDISETDRYNRLLRYVYIDNLMVNAELVRLGYAEAKAYPPDVKYRDMFNELQQQAMQAKKGIWSNQVSEPPSSLQVTTVYLGNKNSKKFHKSTCSSVNSMKESNKVLLNSREEAISNGYVPCKICNP